MIIRFLWMMDENGLTVFLRLMKQYLTKFTFIHKEQMYQYGKIEYDITVK